MYSKYKRDISERRESERIHRLIVQGALHTDETVLHRRRNTTVSHTMHAELEDKDPIQEARNRQQKLKNMLSQRSNARMSTWLAQTDNTKLLSCKQPEK